MQKAIVKKCKDFYQRVEAVEKGGEIGDYMYPSKYQNENAHCVTRHGQTQRAQKSSPPERRASNG